MWKIAIINSLLSFFCSTSTRIEFWELFYSMAVALIFEDESNEGQKLKVFHTNDNRCWISAGEIDNDDGLRDGWVTLDSNDLTILILELQSIKRKIDEDE